MVDSDERELGRLRSEHGERLKELAALHHTARLMRDSSLSVEELLASVARLLPPAMQFPEDTVARVCCGPLQSGPALAVKSLLARDFHTVDRRAGVIEIGYRSEHAEAHEGPFLPEERALIDSIADMLCSELDRRTIADLASDHEVKLALATATASLAIWEWDVEQDRVTTSPEATQIVQRPIVSGPLGVNSHVIHQGDRDRMIGAVRDALARPDHVFEEQFRVIRADDTELWISARGRVVPASKERPTRVIAVVADITRRKLLEATVFQLQKMEAMARLAAGVAHDFNNLLGVITLNTGEMLELLPAGDPCRVLAGEIQEVLRRGAALTQQMLAFSRRSQGKAIPLEPDQVIRAAEMILRRMTGPGKQLVMRLDCACRVLADSTQLDQILMNLVVNARDAVADGGTITITTRVDEVDADTARVYEHVTPGPHAAITVADDGPGIPAEAMSRLFEPFFTTKAGGKGTGLGLAVVFGIVRQSGGFITVESEPGRGARFTVRLPVRG